MTLSIGTMRLLIERELEGLKREIEAYPDDASVWATPPGIANSAGSLALHCAGNLQHFIGAKLGGTSYVRDRESEFKRREVSRAELVAELDRAHRSVLEAFDQLTAESLPEVFPDQVGGKALRSDVFVPHLAIHLAYHLGQVDYHRRITTGESRTVDTVAVSALPNAVA